MKVVSVVTRFLDLHRRSFELWSLTTGSSLRCLLSYGGLTCLNTTEEQLKEKDMHASDRETRATARILSGKDLTAVWAVDDCTRGSRTFRALAHSHPIDITVRLLFAVDREDNRNGFISYATTMLST
jgi:hypothetical protein